NLKPSPDSEMAIRGRESYRSVRRSGLGAGVADALGDRLDELLEVLAEHRRELLRLLVVGRRVRPGLPRLQYLVRHAGHADRDVEPEDRVHDGLDVVKRAA